MNPRQSDRIIELASQRTLLRAADVRSAGLNPQLLVKLHGNGRLRRVARGIYALPDVQFKEAQFTEHQTLAEVCQRVPKAVVCLLSALQLHDVGTQLPHQVWIALPEATQTPRLIYPPLRTVRLRGAAYSEGIETVMANGAPIRTYNVAKTLTDCFKFRNKTGLDVALEALKDAWRQRKATMADISHFAQINRVARVMQPYLETLVA